MRNTRTFWRTVLNIVLGGMALIAAVKSYPGASQSDTYFYIVGLLTWIFASFVFISRPDDDVAHLSYLMSVGLMSICSVNGTFSVTDQGWESKFIPLFQFASTIFVPCIFFRCFASFPSEKRFAANRFFRWWVYAPAILLFTAMSISYLTGNSYRWLFFLIDMRWFTILNLICLFGYSIAGHACLLHTWLCGETDTQRKQAKWLFLGISMGTVPVAIFHTIPSITGASPLFGNFSAYTLVLIMLCYAVAIARYGLMDIKLVLNRSSVYAVLSGVMLAIYLASIKIYNSVISRDSEDAVGIFAALVVALLFTPVKRRVQDFIDKYFDQRRYDYRIKLENLSGTLSTILRLDDLVDTLLRQLEEVLQPEFAGLLLKGGAEFQVYRQIGDEHKLKETLSELDPESVSDRPKRIGGRKLAIPLLSKGVLVGVILLGGKLSEKRYNAEDVSLMTTLSNQTAISIENALIYEELRRQIAFMREAYDRLVGTFRKSYPEHLPPEKPASEGEDIMAELDMIADALIRSSEELRVLDDLKSQFISNVSHDLRTPLTIIKGFADNLLDGIAGELDDGQRKYMEGIAQNCERLVRMVDDLLMLSRILAGKISLVPVKVSLSSLISEVMFGLTTIAEKKKVSLTSNCPPDVTLLADKDKLERILINLLHNAIKFTPSGGKVWVSVQDRGEYVDISVEDTGIGIPPERLDEIFQRFQQVQGKDKWKSEGLGLGLSIVKELVELHGGSVSARSEPDKGSQFTVRLPKGEKEYDA